MSSSITLPSASADGSPAPAMSSAGLGDHCACHTRRSLGAYDAMVVVVVVLVLAALAANNRQTPTARVLVASAVADLIAGRWRAGAETVRSRRSRSRS